MWVVVVADVDVVTAACMYFRFMLCSVVFVFNAVFALVFDLVFPFDVFVVVMSVRVCVIVCCYCVCSSSRL